MSMQWPEVSFRGIVGAGTSAFFFALLAYLAGDHDKFGLPAGRVAHGAACVGMLLAFVVVVTDVWKSGSNSGVAKILKVLGAAAAAFFMVAIALILLWVMRLASGPAT